MSLTGKTQAATYKDLLQMDNSNNGVDSTVRPVLDGEGTASSLSISSSKCNVKSNLNNTAAFYVTNRSDETVFNIDTSNTLIKAGIGQHIVNTQVKEFSISSNSDIPSSSNWTAISCVNGDSSGEILAGSGASPAAISIDGTTNIASNLVSVLWYVPLNITVDVCHLWVGADSDSGDSIEFQVMKYSLDKTDSATCGDLSSPVKLFGSSSITNDGDEQADYRELSPVAYDVDAGEGILAFIKAGGTNSDYTINAQLIYHLR